MKTTGSSRMEMLKAKLAEVMCPVHVKLGIHAGSEDETCDSKPQRGQDSLGELQTLPAQMCRHDIDEVDEHGCVGPRRPAAAAWNGDVGDEAGRSQALVLQ